MFRLLRSVRAGLALIVLTILYACDSTGPGSTSLSILLTDAPGDVKAAVVTITQVYLQGGEDDECEDETDDEDEVEDDDEDEDERGNGRGNGNGNGNRDDDEDDETDADEALCTTADDVEGDDDDSGRVVVTDEDRTVDLLTLTTSTTELVSGLNIPAGRYSQLRMVITGGYLEVENADGSTSIYASSPDYAGLPPGAVVAGELRMPSFGSSGLKVKFPGGGLDLDGIESVLLVDFDVSQSFGHLNGSNAWVMHPVVRGSRVESVAAAQQAAAVD